MINRAVLSLLIIVFSITLADSVHAAGVDTSPVGVGARVVASCMVETMPVDFGNYTGVEQRAEGDIRVRCTAGAVYNITLDAGANLIGLWRGITNGSGNRMNYGIFKLSNYTGLWGDNNYDSTYGFGSSLADSSNGAWQSHPVYGKLFGGQSYSAGTFSDTVNVTVHY